MQDLYQESQALDFNLQQDFQHGKEEHIEYVQTQMTYQSLFVILGVVNVLTCFGIPCMQFCLICFGLINGLTIILYLVINWIFGWFIFIPEA